MPTTYMYLSFVVAGRESLDVLYIKCRRGS